MVLGFSDDGLEFLIMKLKNFEFLMTATNVQTGLDDGVLDDDRVRRVIRGRRRKLHLREYNRGEGDWETVMP